MLLFVDMDGMKSINDTLGHQEGDKALIAVARILRESFRGTDIIARLGGDEFAILALQTSDIGTDSMQAGLRANLERANANSGSPFRLELSVGAIVSGPDDPMALAQLLAMADEQMYQQKRGRKHRAHGFADIREGPGRRSESDSRRGQ